MKKLLLVFVLVSLGGWTELRAQAQKGTTYWGGTVRLDGQFRQGKDSGSGVDPKFRSGQHAIAPEIQWGKFVSPTTLVGLGVGYNLNWSGGSREGTNTDPKSTSRSINQSVAVLPFVRKYRFINERWAVFLHGEAGPTLGWQKYKSTTGFDSDTKQTPTQYVLDIKPGLVYSFPGKRLSIEGYADILSLGVQYSPLRREENQPGRFSFSTGISTGFPGFFRIRLAKNINSKTSAP